MKRHVIIAILFFVVGIALLGVVAYFSVIAPAWASVQMACFPEKFEESSYVVAGTFSVNESTADTGGEIDIRIPDTPEFAALRGKIMKHELCHAKQYQQGRIFGCAAGGALRFTNEVECYVAEEMPDKVWEVFWGN